MKERHEWVEMEIGVLKEDKIKGSWNSEVVNGIKIYRNVMLWIKISNKRKNTKKKELY